MLQQQNGGLIGICDWCSALIDRPLCHLKRSQHHFCNWQHYQAWKAERQLRGKDHPQYVSITYKCDYCGNLVTKPPSRWGDGELHFCNNVCYGNWISQNRSGRQHYAWTDRLQMNCGYCGDPIEVKPWLLKYAERFFCNSDCQYEWMRGANNPAWRGGYEPYYGPNWEQQRRQARERDTYTCRACGISEAKLGRALDVHHLIPFREFGRERYELANHLANLLSLCHSCHIELEGLPLKEQIKRTNHSPVNREYQATVQSPVLPALAEIWTVLLPRSKSK